MYYREQIKFYAHEVLEYDRKSRFDDPLLSVEEVLARHSQIMNDYALEHLGGPIPEENKYKEVGSSESIDERPEMLRLLKAIENPAIKAIMAVEVQRLSRGDLEDAGRLIKLLRYSNTYVITPMKIYDLRDDYDRDAFERELKKGNEYLEYFKKIQARGRLASVKAGNYVGSVAPFGFDRMQIKDGKKDCFKLIEKKDEADIVRMIFHWFCEEDIGPSVICRRLEKMGVRTKQDCPSWKPSTIYSMLENVHYIGCVRWNWRKTIKLIEEQEIKKIRPKAKVGEYLVFEGKHDGIISEEQFKKAAEIRGKRHKTKSDTTLKNPFSGVMFCGCGRKIGYNTYNTNGKEVAPPKLVCNDQVHCKTGSVDFAEAMEYVCNTLRDCIDDFKLRINHKQDDSVKLHASLIESLEKKIKELDKQELEQWKAQSHPNPAERMPSHIFQQLNEELLLEKDKVKKALAEDYESSPKPVDYKERVMKFNEELLLEKDKVKKALAEAYESSPKPVDYKERVMKFKDALKALENPEISAKIKNQYVRDIIERIDYTRPPIVRITKKNMHLYEADTKKGLQYHVEPYKIKITLKD